MSLVDLFNQHPSGMNATGKSQLMKDASTTLQYQQNKWGGNIHDDLNLLYYYFKFDGERNWEWVSTYQSTPEDEAKIRKLNSETDRNYQQMETLSSEEIRQGRFSGGYNQEITVQDKMDAVERFTVGENEEVIIESDFVPIDLESLKSL